MTIIFLLDKLDIVKRLTYVMSITIKDVANKAGVSIATVSLILNNNERISTETKRRVLKAVKELDYHPSRSARRLVANVTGNIGFILTDDHFLKTEPFYTRIFLGTEFATRENEYYVLLATVDTNFKEGDSLPQFIQERSVDGIIIAGKVPNALINNLDKYHIPIVFVDYYPPKGDYSVVMIDNIKGGMSATQHLIEYNHRNIAFVGADIMHPSISYRLYGYKQALQNAGINIREEFINTEETYPNRQCGYSAVKKLFERIKDITAVFACNDAMAIGVMQYCVDNGIKIPDDISLIGFDDVEADLLLNPSLTTIRVPKVEMGIEAMNLIVSVIKNKLCQSTKKIVVPVELIVRKSTMRIENIEL